MELDDQLDTLSVIDASAPGLHGLQLGRAFDHRERAARRALVLDGSP